MHVTFTFKHPYINYTFYAPGGEATTGVIYTEATDTKYGYINFSLKNMTVTFSMRV